MRTVQSSDYPARSAWLEIVSLHFVVAFLLFTQPVCSVVLEFMMQQEQV